MAISPTSAMNLRKTTLPTWTLAETYWLTLPPPQEKTDARSRPSPYVTWFLGATYSWRGAIGTVGYVVPWRDVRLCA